MPFRVLLCCFTIFFTQSCADSISSSAESKLAKQATLIGVPVVADDAAAHWLNEKQLVVLGDSEAVDLQYLLVVGSIDSQGKGGNVAQQYLLTKQLLSAIDLQKFPHLSKGLGLTFADPLPSKQLKNLLKKPLYLMSVTTQQNPEKVHQLQIGNVLDDLYTKGADDANEVKSLGATMNTAGIQFSVWAPTANNVEVLLYNDDKTSFTTPSLTLIEDTHTGVWSATLPDTTKQLYYQYELELYHPKSQQVERLITTDPYSLSLSTNSQYSQVVDLNHANTQPESWLTQQRPAVKNFEDNIFYELHIGDFSQHDTALKDDRNRGHYLAFTEQHSDGIGHLKQLRQAGLNNIHLLPTFDLGSINEDTQQRLTPLDSVAKLCAIQADNILCKQSINQQQSIQQAMQLFKNNGSDVQAVMEKLRLVDDYNWGYDPYHYTVPEGGYANNPEGVSRIVEFRTMVQSLHNMGFRVIMDVVYNHTHQAGLDSKSVLDKIVPNYYQRLNPITGLIERSTCCDNTATERVMMAKLMTDSLVVWARDYGIDGFRFDLMAHQPKAAMLAARDAVLAVDPDNYFYGEGWNFGEVANNQRFVQASQLELGGTEIGTFTDRLRDAVRGGGMTAAGDGIRKEQGIGNGLFTVPNELRSNADSIDGYLLMSDQLRVGLAGNLATFPIINAAGEQVTGKDIPYGNQPTGYALDPADTINYVSKHDNQTLWDNNQYRNSFALNIDDRVRLQTLSLSYPLLAQGIPFLHMGSEMLRSKSYLRDSYDFGHWFNKVDFSQQTNNYNVGLPPATTDKQNWQLIEKIINNNHGKDIASSMQIQFSYQRFLELLEIRMSSPLFRLASAVEINQQVQFLNTGPDQQLGLIVMSITDQSDIDENYQQIIVLFNSSAQPQNFAYAGADKYQLHPVQASCADSLLCTSKAQQNGFMVSKFSTAVFVLAQ